MRTNLIAVPTAVLRIRSYTTLVKHAAGSARLGPTMSNRSASAINGTVRHNSGQFDCPSDRVGLETGVCDLGAPGRREPRATKNFAMAGPSSHFRASFPDGAFQR